jgi:hypothetical protein
VPLAAQSTVCVAGPVSAAASPTFSIPSTSVLTSDATPFADAVEATTFINSLIGQVATVRGIRDGSR